MDGRQIIEASSMILLPSKSSAETKDQLCPAVCTFRQYIYPDFFWGGGANGIYTSEGMGDGGFIFLSEQMAWLSFNDRVFVQVWSEDCDCHVTIQSEHDSKN